MHINSNELLAWLRTVFATVGYETSEHALIKKAVAKGLLNPGFNDNSLLLFHTHFVLFNALYRLSDQLREQSLRLDINSIKISLQPLKASIGGQDISTDSVNTLRDYYLDWSNLEDATDKSVDALLDSFWQRFGEGPIATTEKDAALKVLGLEASESVTFKVVKQTYRRLVMIEHPDRGGNKEHLQVINDAMAVLVRAYGKR